MSALTRAHMGVWPYVTSGALMLLGLAFAQSPLWPRFWPELWAALSFGVLLTALLHQADHALADEE